MLSSPTKWKIWPKLWYFAVPSPLLTQFAHAAGFAAARRCLRFLINFLSHLQLLRILLYVKVKRWVYTYIVVQVPDQYFFINTTYAKIFV